MEINDKYVSRNESLEWGVLRTGDGTDYKAVIPEEKEIKKGIENIMQSKQSTTAKALEYFIWGAKEQLFWDGNKRTSLICANKILLQEGAS